MRKLKKPTLGKVRSGFRPLPGLNTTGARARIPHDASSPPSSSGAEFTKRMANVRASKGRKMY